MGTVPPGQAMGASTWAGGKSIHSPPGSPDDCVLTNSCTHLKRLLWNQLCALDSHALPVGGRGLPALFSKAHPANLRFSFSSAALPALPPSDPSCLMSFLVSGSAPALPNSSLARALPPATPWLLYTAGLSGDLAVWAAVLWAQVALADASSFHSCE